MLSEAKPKHPQLSFQNPASRKPLTSRRAILEGMGFDPYVRPCTHEEGEDPLNLH